MPTMFMPSPTIFGTVATTHRPYTQETPPKVKAANQNQRVEVTNVS